jgi:hypothetical protein
VRQVTPGTPEVDLELIMLTTGLSKEKTLSKINLPTTEEIKEKKMGDRC